jgi:hypothetical protein
VTDLEMKLQPLDYAYPSRFWMYIRRGVGLLGVIAIIVSWSWISKLFHLEQPEFSSTPVYLLGVGISAALFPMLWSILAIGRVRRKPLILCVFFGVFVGIIITVTYFIYYTMVVIMTILLVL